MTNYNHLCPKCGKRSMVQQKLPNGKYMLVCTLCGEKRGPFKPDLKKGVA